jgi:hypothetical protein
MVLVTVNMIVVASDTGLVMSHTGFGAVNMTFVTLDTGLFVPNMGFVTSHMEFVTFYTGLVTLHTAFVAALVGLRDAVAGRVARAPGLRVARACVAVARAVARPLVVPSVLHKLFARPRSASRRRMCA